MTKQDRYAGKMTEHYQQIEMNIRKSAICLALLIPALHHLLWKVSMII